MIAENRRIRKTKPETAKFNWYMRSHVERSQRYGLTLAQQFEIFPKPDPKCTDVRNKAAELDESQEFRRMPLDEAENLWERWVQTHVLNCCRCRKHAHEHIMIVGE